MNAPPRLETSFAWTAQQAEAHAKILAFLDGPSGVFVLKGFAGTGKTTLCVDALRRRRARACFTAPTHKAVGVLAGRGLVDGAEYATIHRLLGCKRERVDGESHFVPNFDRAQWPEFDVIVVDEVSMVGDTVWQWLADARARWPRHVICMGDPAQLPPVKDGDGLSPAFAQTDAELTDVQRSGGLVLAAANTVREHLDAHQPVQVELGENVLKVSRAEFFSRALADFRAHRDAKILAWTNDAVEYCNAYVRRELFGADVPDAPQTGERRVVVSTWTDEDQGVTLHAEQDVEIYEAKEATLFDLPVWRIDADVDAELYQLRPEGAPEYRRRLANLRHECRAGRTPWRDFYRLDEAFVNLRPGYATTVHKSQGSTYRTAYVVDRNLKQCPDPLTRNMLRYVAFSRASHALVIS